MKYGTKQQTVIRNIIIIHIIICIIIHIIIINIYAKYTVSA